MRTLDHIHYIKRNQTIHQEIKQEKSTRLGEDFQYSHDQSHCHADQHRQRHAETAILPGNVEARGRNHAHVSK